MTEPRQDFNPSQNPPALDGIEHILRQAQMQHMQLALEVTFNRNMEAFKQLSPQIYDQFIAYQPEELRLIYTDDGHLNLANYQLNNKLVYQGDPVEFSQNQYQAFKALPTLSNIKFGKSIITNEDHIHPNIINRYIDFFEETKDTQQRHTQVPIGFMLVTGCGLGYHIAKMVEELDIYNLCIFDPHKDSFYAALHTIDWLPILQKMTTQGRMLKLFIGVEPKDAMTDMKLMTDKIGLFNFVYTFIYRHFSSEKETAFIELYKKEFHLAAAGTGFFDDEKISLAHTVYNINKGFKYLKSGNQVIEDTPLFLIANGPSLDKHIDYIRKHQNNAIIMTCGTAISSLAKTGIKPDFHIEMERSAITPSFLKHGTTAEYREGVSLICLNTAAPQMTELFDDVCLAVKPNDLGALFIEKTYPDQPQSKLILCNPTVTNAGLSCGLTLGFKNIVLLGVDLGMPSDGEHHSALSIYHDIEKKNKTTAPVNKGNYNIPGNFGGTVSTNPILHSTKNNMEMLLRHIERSGISVNVLNPNNGALIDCTQTVQSHDLPDYSGTAKAQVIHTIKTQLMAKLPPKYISDEDFKSTELKDFYALKAQLILPKNINNSLELHAAMNKIFKTIIKENPINKLLLRGSINSAFTLLVNTTLFCKNNHDFKHNYQRGRALYMELLKRAFESMEQHPLQCDTSRDKVAIALAN
ncbi:MAG: 6-hydroxymethylpterin diphosphokinase MptE-like protein [Marinagarivorans sp.]|nr:6-hydroxymethylpterin diphosphokinase MptE-like protein [Marinagarivorans sp.]